jgi:hypothetical protein
VGKHRSNLQYFKGKKLQSKIFNQLNIKKIKSTKIILEKKRKKVGKVEKKRKVILKKKRIKGESWKKKRKSENKR